MEVKNPRDFASLPCFLREREMKFVLWIRPLSRSGRIFAGRQLETLSFAGLIVRSTLSGTCRSLSSSLKVDYAQRLLVSLP